MERKILVTNRRYKLTNHSQEPMRYFDVAVTRFYKNIFCFLNHKIRIDHQHMFCHCSILNVRRNLVGEWLKLTFKLPLSIMLRKYSLTVSLFKLSTSMIVKTNKPIINSIRKTRKRKNFFALRNYDKIRNSSKRWGGRIKFFLKLSMSIDVTWHQSMTEPG